MKKLFTLGLLVSVLISSCEKPADDIDDPVDPEVKFEKSAKRGLSYNLTHAADLDTLKRGVSWWYNWYVETGAPENYHEEYEMDFYPMLWGGSPSADLLDRAESTLLDHPELEYLLVMNEPNLVDQAHRTPQQAIHDWRIYEEFVDRMADQGHELKLVGPQMNWGTLPGYSDPVVWLDEFFTLFEATYGRPPQLHHLGFHWYDYGLDSQLDRLSKYGKAIWVTEMANWNANVSSYADQVEQMTEMVAICERRDDVFRYAWFIGRGGYPDQHFTYLFGPEPGDLRELGQIYIGLPY